MGQLINNNRQQGSLIIEILVAFGLATILLPVILFGFISGLGGRAQQEQRLKATAFLKEAEEAVRSIRDADWNAIASPAITMGDLYHPVPGASAWSLVSGSETLGDFTRSVVIDDLVPSDVSKKQVTVTVSWNNVVPVSVSNTFYLSRWKNLTSDLSVSGTLINQGSGDWCAPSLTLGTVDLPRNGVGKNLSAIQGQIATGTGANASGVSYANVTVTDPAAPATPSATVAGSFDGYKTNDVFTEQNYAYLATDTNSKEAVIIDLNSLSGGKYSEAGYFNAPGNGSASSVATYGNVGYITNGTKLYNFDLSSKSGSRSALDADGVTLPGTATKLIVRGNRAYVATSSTTNQLVVVDVGNSSNLTILRSVALDGLGGKSLYINSTGTRAYVATSNSSTKNEMFIVNIDETTPNWLTLTGTQLTKGSFNTNGMDPTGIVLVNLPKVIVVGTGGTEYQVIDVTNESSPTSCGNLNFDQGINGIATVYTTAQRAYAYIVSDVDPELRIIEGGPGGGGSGGGLTVESSSLDTGHSSTFNNISIVNITPSSGVTVTYEIAISTDCATFNYSGNYTTAGGAISSGLNPGRCFRYRAIFSGGTGNTNVATTVRVNYSP